MNNNSKLEWGECPDKSWTAIGHKHAYRVKKKSYGLWELEIEYGNACPVCRDSVDPTFLYQCAQFHHDSITSLLAERDEKIFKEICNMLQVKSADYADKHDVADNDVTACHMSGGSMACNELVAEVKAIQEALSLHKKGVA